MKKLIVIILLLNCIVVKAQVKKDTLRGIPVRVRVNNDPIAVFNINMHNAQQGDPAAMNALGVLYSKGEGVAMDDQQALKWFQKSAEAGYAGAYYNLGELYKDGLGVPQDFVKAYKYFKQCAGLGNAKGYFRQGFMLYKGFGADQNYQQAYELFKKSAGRGNLAGMYMLGLCYRNGYGITANTDSASFWLNKSANAGYQKSKEELALAQPENSYTAQAIEFPIVHTSRLAAANVKLDNGFQAVKHQLSKNNNISGEYNGYAIKFDWSGKYIIGQSKLKLTLSQQGEILNGNWVEEDTVITPVEAKLTDSSAVFNNTGYNRTDHYNAKTPDDLAFKNASLKLVNKDDTVLITGNLHLYSNLHKEPEKPMYIILVRTGADQNRADSSAVNAALNSKPDPVKFMVYPNPFGRMLNIQYTLDKPVTISVTLSRLSDASVAYKSAAQQMQPGEYTTSIDVNAPPGTYVATLTYGNKIKSVIVFKQ